MIQRAGEEREGRWEGEREKKKRERDSKGTNRKYKRVENNIPLLKSKGQR